MTDTNDMQGLIGALKNQSQCDEDGVMCIVSRQAVDEAIDALECQHSQQAQGKAVLAMTARINGDSIETDTHTDALLKLPEGTHHAYFGAPPAPAAVPEGWKLVPVDPSLEMVVAGGGAIDMNGGEGGDDEMQSDAIHAYCAMLAAAPTPAEPDHIADVNKKVEEESEENHG